jgi:CRP-like cAMP-binding protein
VEERIARSLLRMQDLTGQDEIPTTHEFLALLLGVQRQTVTLAAGKLQREGLIRYGRGHITIVNREGLKAASCECYRAMRRAQQRLFD